MAITMVLKIPEVLGEMQEKPYEGCIALLSFSFGLVRGKRNLESSEICDYNDLSVVKYFDMTSPLFFEACDLGTIFPEVTMILASLQGDKEKLVEFKLTNAKVCAYRPGGASQSCEERPLEEVAFVYEKIECTYYLPKNLRTEAVQYVKRGSQHVNISPRILR